MYIQPTTPPPLSESQATHIILHYFSRQIIIIICFFKSNHHPREVFQLKSHRTMLAFCWPCVLMILYVDPRHSKGPIFFLRKFKKRKEKKRVPTPEGTGWALPTSFLSHWLVIYTLLEATKKKVNLTYHVTQSECLNQAKMISSDQS